MKDKDYVFDVGDTAYLIGWTLLIESGTMRAN